MLPHVQPMVFAASLDASAHITFKARGTHRLDGTQSNPRHGSCIVENLINLSKTVLKRYCVSSSTIE
jgi:hypothetical protein